MDVQSNVKEERDHPTPIAAAPIGKRAVEFLRAVYPKEAPCASIGRGIGASRQSTHEALRREESRGSVVRGSKRGAWRARVEPITLSQDERPVPALHAIQVALPGVRVQGGFPVARATLTNGRRLTVQEGLASVYASHNPVPVAEWKSFVEDLRAGLLSLGVVLDESKALVVSVELNADYESWRLRDMNQVKLQTWEGWWAQIYNKMFDDGRQVMRVEVRASPKGWAITGASETFDQMRSLGFVEAAAVLRKLCEPSQARLSARRWVGVG